MKLFPDKNLTVALTFDRATSLNKLRDNTKLTETLVSGFTDREFIGQINDSGFKIISSEIGRGAVCVFTGELQDSIGTVERIIHQVFKVMFSILLLMPMFGFGIAVWMLGMEKSIALVVPMIISLILIRFVFVELSFYFISKTGMNKLTRIVGMKEIK